MPGTPTFATAAGFLGLPFRDDHEAAFQVAGIPLDIGTTNRAGARDGPATIRRASRMLVDGCHPEHWVNPRTGMDIADLGEFPVAIGDIPSSLALIEAAAARCRHLVALGGEHLITLPLLRALRKRHAAPLGLLHVDAHLDTWPINFGMPLAHGTVFFRAIEEGLVDPRRMVQVGIRSPVDRETWDWTVGQGVTIVSGQQAQLMGPTGIADCVRAVLGDAPCYLSFDVDGLDPAFAPATGTPEIGGLATWQAQAMLRRLQGVGFVGMDVVEVSPAHDVAEITALAAATMAWEYLALLGVAGQAAPPG
jgi:agmatinase